MTSTLSRATWALNKMRVLCGEQERSFMFYQVERCNHACHASAAGYNYIILGQSLFACHAIIHQLQARLQPLLVGVSHFAARWLDCWIWAQQTGVVCLPILSPGLWRNLGPLGLIHQRFEGERGGGGAAPPPLRCNLCVTALTTVQTARQSGVSFTAEALECY